MDGSSPAFHDVKKFFLISLALVAGGMSLWLARAQSNPLGPGKDFTFPDYYPSTNGVVRLRSVITGKEYRFLSNNTFIALTEPRIESFREDGVTLEWTAIAREATVDINTREVHGPGKMYFRTADDGFFQTGVGFLWQQSNSVVILSNKTFTWIDTRKLTNSSARYSMNNMKTFVAATLVATSRLTAAEMEIPPARPGLTINAEFNTLIRKSNMVIFRTNVVVIDPSSKPGEAPMILTCDWLVGKQGDTGKFSEIEAHERVTIDKGGTHARGNYAIYTATNELMALVGAFDPADTNHPHPYLFYYPNTNSPSAITNSGKAIIYDRVKDELSSFGGVITEVPGTTLKSSPAINATANPTNRAPKIP
jgi:lipopolysaccharide export system protein LptA